MWKRSRTTTVAAAFLTIAGALDAGQLPGEMELVATGDLSIRGRTSESVPLPFVDYAIDGRDVAVAFEETVLVGRMAPVVPWRLEVGVELDDRSRRVLAGRLRTWVESRLATELRVVAAEVRAVVTRSPFLGIDGIEVQARVWLIRVTDLRGAMPERIAASMVIRAGCDEGSTAGTSEPMICPDGSVAEQPGGAAGERPCPEPDADVEGRQGECPPGPNGDRRTTGRPRRGAS